MRGPFSLAVATVIVVLGLFGIHGFSPAAAQLEAEYVSHPSRIPLLDDFSTPQIEPGGDGRIAFDLTNRYDHNITRLVLSLEVYRFADLDTSEALEHLDEVPTFRSGSAGDGTQGACDRSSITFTFAAALLSKQKVRLDVKVHAPLQSRIGTYFVRTHIEFAMEGETFWMASRGHFGDADWRGYEDDGNLTRLGEVSQMTGLHGITPDTSFGIKEPTDFTFFYVIGGLIVAIGALTVFFYLMDEKGKFPGVKKKLDGAWERMRGIGGKEKDPPR